MQSINPVNGQIIKEHPEPNPEEVAAQIDRTQQAWLGWRETSFAQRSGILHKMAEVLRSRSDEYARLMCLEMGKPLAEGRSEVEKSAWVCDYYAEHAEGQLAAELIASNAEKSYVAHKPMGIVLAVMPWNFPFWQVLRFAAPALMAGNAGLLKHASNVPGSALAIEDSFRAAGLPDDVFKALLVGSKQVDAIIEHPHVKAVTLTGSAPAGRAVAARAGSMLKKTVLELGGSDPYLILEDADLALALPACVTSRMINGGQSCIAAKRFIVVESRREEFEQGLIKLMREKKMGDPMAEDTDLGPLARRDLRDELHNQVQRALAQGARLLLGGEIPKGPGAFYPPTVLTDVKADNPANREELFGPVAAIIPVADEEEAIRMANDSIFGLGACVFSKDQKRAEAIAADRIEAGSCFVNAFVRSDPRLPFGGIKESGYGRELAAFGIREFVNTKTVYIK